jgi:2,3,4,5-tetrahydropyridine-2-carboxylate N-succinyltransferase
MNYCKATIDKILNIRYNYPTSDMLLGACDVTSIEKDVPVAEDTRRIIMSNDNTTLGTEMPLVLLHQVMRLFESGIREANADTEAVVDAFLRALEAGTIRCATREVDGNWIVNPAVKQGILLGFRTGRIVEIEGSLPFADKHTFGVLRPNFAEHGIRIVPGGSSVRSGAYLGHSVTVMPPAYINVGAYVDEGTMVDSHALVGSCAQIGKRVHLSAAAQIGGVLEPVGAQPVIIEDDCLIGGGCGIYEGTLVRQRAVLGAGVILTRSTKVYDLVNEKVLQGTNDSPLEIPEGAVVIPGSRPATGEFARAHGLQASCALIVKYRDGNTDAATTLESTLR